MSGGVGAHVIPSSQQMQVDGDYNACTAANPQPRNHQSPRYFVFAAHFSFNPEISVYIFIWSMQRLCERRSPDVAISSCDSRAGIRSPCTA